MDSIMKIGKSLVHHGEENSRAYIMKADESEIDSLIRDVYSLAEAKGYGKIIAKVPETLAGKLSIEGFRLEASVPGFYDGSEDGVFMAKFLDETRENSRDEDAISEILESAKAATSDRGEKELDEGFTTVICSERDAEEMSRLYRSVFETYPFPIFDRDYIVETMNDNVCYYGVRHGGKLVALSSSEMDKKSRNTEMTDFATLPEYRGKSLSRILLREMEQDMKERGIATAYTIARAIVPGVNFVFSKGDYTYGGTLVNNTKIDGSIESMNIWYKSL